MKLQSDNGKTYLLVTVPIGRSVNCKANIKSSQLMVPKYLRFRYSFIYQGTSAYGSKVSKV